MSLSIKIYLISSNSLLEIRAWVTLFVDKFKEAVISKETLKIFLNHTNNYMRLHVIRHGRKKRLNVKAAQTSGISSTMSIEIYVYSVYCKYDGGGHIIHLHIKILKN